MAKGRQATGQLPLDHHLVADLHEALRTGQGVERPIRCPSPAHMDANASASVNVLKQVWYCYACNASGKVDSTAVPKAIELLEMVEPETAGRTYPEHWLRWFTNGADAADYWKGRFAAWVPATLGFGSDPLTREPTFPVYTPQGRLAGVGRRTARTDQKYKYPWRWSASRNLAGYHHALTHRLDTSIVFLVEGAADQAAMLEAGGTAFGCYGAGLHLPQIELIARVNPQLVVFAFDADDAGRKAITRSEAALDGRWPAVALDWSLYSGNDPADISVHIRTEAMTETVAATRYRVAHNAAGRFLDQALRLA